MASACGIIETSHKHTLTADSECNEAATFCVNCNTRCRSCCQVFRCRQFPSGLSILPTWWKLGHGYERPPRSHLKTCPKLRNNEPSWAWARARARTDETFAQCAMRHAPRGHVLCSSRLPLPLSLASLRCCPAKLAIFMRQITYGQVRFEQLWMSAVSILPSLPLSFLTLSFSFCLWLLVVPQLVRLPVPPLYCLYDAVNITKRATFFALAIQMASFEESLYPRLALRCWPFACVANSVQIFLIAPWQ